MIFRISIAESLPDIRNLHCDSCFRPKDCPPLILSYRRRLSSASSRINRKLIRGSCLPQTRFPSQLIKRVRTRTHLSQTIESENTSRNNSEGKSEAMFTDSREDEQRFVRNAMNTEADSELMLRTGGTQQDNHTLKSPQNKNILRGVLSCLEPLIRG